MSLYKDASLVMIPSAYKDGKLYSIRPTDGSGDFTFSRGSNLAATRVDVNGLIEKGRENVIVYSQDFSNANWSTNASATISHGITDPNGGSTASRITFTANVNSGIYQQNPTLFASGNVRTASLYMKGAVGGEVVMFGDATNRTSVTLTTSWVRYEGFGIDASTYFIIYTNTSSPSADTIDIAFVQYENGLVATDYIETGTSAAQSGILEDMPRLDYSGGASCPSLLLEPQRSNVMPFSEYFGAWDIIGGSVTQTANNATSPEGVDNAYLAEGNGAQKYVLWRDDVSVPSAGDYTISAFFKYTNNQWIYMSASNFDGGMGAYFDIQNGVVGQEGTPNTASVEDYGNGWYRCIIKGSIGASDLTGRFTLYVARTNGTTDFSTTAAANGQSVNIYGAQLEQGSYPTSYIPCMGTSQTRSLDSCLATSVSDVIGQTDGTMFFDVNISRVVGNEAIGTINSGAYANHATIQRVGSTIQFVRNSATQSGATIVTSATITAGRYKLAIAYKSGDTACFLNGAQVSTTQTQTFTNATLNAVKIGTDAIGALPISDSIKQAVLFKTRLTNTELASLTTL